jgi:serine/threonine-protein kinase
MIPRRAMLAAVLILLSCPSYAQPREAWKIYVNDRFGTSIEYPSRFRPGRPPDNNDGLSFTASDGATLAVWDSFNIDELDIKALEADISEGRVKGERITYRASGKNWFVLSGTRGDSLFYSRYLLSHRGEVKNALEIVYPAALTSAYDPIVARISKSLRPGRGYQIPGRP